MAHREFTQAMLPKFQAINPLEIVSQLTKILSDNRKQLAALLSLPIYTWENFMQPLEIMEDELGKFFGPISHLHGVMETEALRKAYNEALPLLIDYHTEITQSKKYFAATTQLSESPNFKNFEPAQQKILENNIRDFKLAGVHLPEEQKAQLANLNNRLSQCMTKFSENVLDATHAFTLHITDKQQLAGLPAQALQLARDNAKNRGLLGFILTLDFPSYSTALKFLDDRDLRETLYKAYVTRASDQGPNAGKWDNTELIQEILETRKNIANLVGFKNYADYSLATKTAKNTEIVLTFLLDLLKRSKPFAEAEFQELVELAKNRDNLAQLKAWDLSYYSEKLSESKFNFTQEDLRPYFPIQQVLNGLFIVVNKLYGLTIREVPRIEVWHEDVKFFAIYDRHDTLRGGLYIDLYARGGKRDGAWMDECRARRKLDQHTLQYPVAFLTCNFMPPVGNEPALLTHDDVITLFHEFGHCLHHMLTKINHPAVGGINGVPWDTVEFPSQFMENFCYEKEALAVLAAHYKTGEPLPEELYAKMVAAKHFQTGLQMIRQLEFALFDFRIHLEWDKTKLNLVQSILNEVRVQSTVISVPEFNRFQHSFSHIFAGGYGAGYYSYKWAEVLSADAYAKFEEQGIFNRDVGLAFMQNILEVGGARDPIVSFVAFRGREPTIDALLKHSGISS